MWFVSSEPRRAVEPETPRIGGRMGDESFSHPQVCTAAHVDPRHASRGAYDCSAALLTLCPNRRRVRLRRSHIRPLRASVQRVRGQHLGVALAAAGDYPHHRDAGGRASIWRR